MAKLSSIMDIGKRSLMNSQNALQTVSHNIASKNVDGYSRQRAEFATNAPTTEGGLRFGTGSRTTKITRVSNDFLEKQIQTETTKLGTSSGKAENMARIENIFNEQMSKGLNQFVTEFFNAFRELANAPDSQATRELVVQSANSLNGHFKEIDDQMKAIQLDIDNQIKSEVSNINTMVKDIAKLNESVERVEFTGAPANDERDQRDQLLKELGKKINIHYTEGDNGNVTVMAGQTGVLVTGSEYATLIAEPTPAKGDKREANVDIVLEYEHTSPVTITKQISGGYIGGALEVRDKIANDIRKNMDELAYGIATKVNEAHEKGYDRYGNTGRQFFDIDENVEGTASRIKVNEDIQKDSWNLSAGSAPNAPGDNRIANLITSLQFVKTMDNDSSSFNDYYNGVVSGLAINIHSSNQMNEHQQAVVEQLKNVRENLSGVNLDEEAIKMLEYQKSYDASAKMIKVADEMFDTILNIKR